MTELFEEELRALRGRHTGFDKRDAIPVPDSALEDLDISLIGGERVDVPKSVVSEGLRVRQLIEHMASADAVQGRLPAEAAGASRVDGIASMAGQLLADFYVQLAEVQGQPVTFLDPAVINPVADEEFDLIDTGITELNDE